MGNGYGQRIAHYQRPVELLDIAKRSQARPAEKQDGQSFKDMFSRELAGATDVTFSRHARERLHSRGIELSDDDMQRMATAVDKAQNKGARETLVMMDDMAFVISVENRTVITVFDRNNLREGVVTSIDSAVIL